MPPEASQIQRLGPMLPLMDFMRRKTSNKSSTISTANFCLCFFLERLTSNKTLELLPTQLGARRTAQKPGAHTVQQNCVQVRARICRSSSLQFRSLHTQASQNKSIELDAGSAVESAVDEAEGNVKPRFNRSHDCFSLNQLQPSHPNMHGPRQKHCLLVAF